MLVIHRKHPFILRRSPSGRTVLVVAHRLSTIKNADIIAVIDKGVIKELGNYETLMTRGGRFARLMQKQKDNQNEDESGEMSREARGEGG